MTYRIQIGAIKHRRWMFSEALPITGPDTVFPCLEDAVFSPHTVHFEYAFTPGEGWMLAPGKLIGPRIVDGEIDKVVTCVFDKDYMYSCLLDECPHEHIPTPDWIKALAAKRMALLPEPPAI
jgi:hypothetical protein